MKSSQKKIKTLRLCLVSSWHTKCANCNPIQIRDFHMFLKNKLKWLSRVERPMPTTYRPLPVCS